MSTLNQTSNPDDKQPRLLATRLLLVALAYFAFGRLGLAIPYGDSHVTLIWLPTGIAVAALWRWGNSHWPAIFIGALATNYSIDFSPLLDCSIAIGNTLAPVAVVWILRRLKFNAAFDSAKDVWLFIAAAAIGMLLSASGGLISLRLFNITTAVEEVTIWLSWWAGDFIGVLLAAPLLLNMSRAAFKTLWTQRVEFSAWLIVTFMIYGLLFFNESHETGYSHQIAFIGLPTVVWAAMRFGVMGSSLGVLLSVFVVALATARGLGPFYTQEAEKGLFQLGVFFFALVLTELMVAALQAGRKKAEMALQQSELQLRTIIETEPECVKVMSREGIVLQMNAAGLQMLGADTPDQIIGQKALGIVMPHHRKAFAALSERVFAGESGHLEFEVVGLTGAHRWLETYEVPMRDTQGNINAMLGITRDVTERKYAEARIHQRAVEQSALLEMSKDLAASLDMRNVLDTIADRATKISNPKSAAIYLLEEDTLRLVAAAPPLPAQFPEELRHAPLADHPHIRRAITTRLPVFMPDTATADLSYAERTVSDLRDLRSIIYLPLIAGTKVKGVLIVGTIEEHKVLNYSDVELYLTFANMAAMAVENATLFESGQRYAADLEQRIIERKQIDDAMRIAAVTFETQEAILITDADARILRVNQAFEEITGYSAAEVVGQNPRIFQSGRHDIDFYQAMWSSLLNTGKWMGEVWDKKKNGKIYPKLVTITAVHDDQQQVTHYVSVFRDISNRKQSEQDIHQLAFYDPLTQLPNRRLLQDHLKQALAVSARNGRHGALLFLDLDLFKVINDTQGHAMGDQLLIEVANRLRDCVRESDSLARLGGDEFVIVLEDMGGDADEAATQTELVAEKIRLELDKPYVLNEFECLSTVSIGVCLFCGHQESAEVLLQHADVAMYQAKAAGRNAIRFFDPQMQAALDNRTNIEADLRHALEKQQFILHYQIQVDQQRRPLGAEVLIRWQHPERGMISPMDFIPLAEDTGLIVPIGLWVLQMACAQLKVWQQDPLTREMSLAVNVSAKQFRHADFVTQVQRVLLESGAKPSHLKLELTESIVLESVEETIITMQKLKLIGVSFSMDDFGTGYSSLQYLKRLPLDQIKIDKSFVRDISTNLNDAAIVQTIIAMTEALGLHVIAEGVETEIQQKFLESRGCHAFQGYFFGRPMPIDQFEGAMRGSRKS